MLQTKAFIISIIIMLIMDSLWLGFIAQDLYLKHIGTLLRLNGDSITPNFLAAAIVYIALAAGIVTFVLPRSNGSEGAAIYYGAMFGLICYAIYDFTNLAVIAKWSTLITLADVAWGTFLCSTTSFFAALLTK